MKKLLNLFVAVLLLAVLAGCQSFAEPAQQLRANTNAPAVQSQGGENQASPASPSPAASAPIASSADYISYEEAKAIALNHAGLNASEVRDLDVELDRDYGTLHYDVDFENGGYDYEYEIDATTGSVLKSRKERD